jgi:hypothetical protein
MVLQAFIDESDDGEFFVMAGYLATPEAWVKFSQEWERLLPHAVLSNSNTYQFKMNEMAKTPERLGRVPMFYRSIEDWALIAVSIQFEVAHLRSALRRVTVSGKRVNWANWNNPYCFAFRALTDCINRRRPELLQILKGHELIHFIFDERSERTKVIWAWDAVRKAIKPEQAALYGKTPRFENDEVFLPLQAADFWAWWVRDWARSGTAPGKHGKFPWTFDQARPLKIITYFDEDGIIEYFIDIAQSALPAGHSVIVLPP